MINTGYFGSSNEPALHSFAKAQDGNNVASCENPWMKSKSKKFLPLDCKTSG